MEEIINNTRRCKDCLDVLIPGDNINENAYKRGRKVCRPCDTKAQKLKREKTNEQCATSEYARWQRVGKLVCDCCGRTREGRVKLTNDSPVVLMKHLREKYPVLPVVCPIYKEIDLIYSSMSLTDEKRYKGISIDRIDATKGYVVNNVQIISDQANRKKTNASLADLLKLIAYGYGPDKKNNNRIIKENGFVFFEKNNSAKTVNNKEILENQGGVDVGFSNYEQVLFDLINNNG